MSAVNYSYDAVVKGVHVVTSRSSTDYTLDDFYTVRFGKMEIDSQRKLFLVSKDCLIC